MTLAWLLIWALAGQPTLAGWWLVALIVVAILETGSSQ